MGYINLPSLDDITQIKDPKQQMDALLNTVGMLMKSLSEINGYLTTQNIKELDARVIKAGTITTEKLEAGAITAEKIDVEELSAITANLGHITAGLIEAVNIYASTFATSQISYPKVVIDPSGNYIRVYRDELNYLQFIPGLTGVPLLSFYSNGNQTATFGAVGATGVIDANNLMVQTDLDIELYPGTGYVKFSSWNTPYSVSASKTLQQELDDLSARISAIGG